MKSKIKIILVVMLIIIGAAIYDITKLKLTGVIIILLAFALGNYDDNDHNGSE